MLRSLVLILLIVNAAFYAWSQGWLNQVLGVRPDAQHEPHRLTQQINAEKIIVLTPAPRVDKGGAQGTTGAAAAASAAGVLPASSDASAPASAAVGTPPASTSAGIINNAATATSGKDVRCVEAGPFTASEYTSVENNLRPILPAGSWDSRTVTVPGVWLAYMGPYADPEMLARKQIELRRLKGLAFEEVHSPPSLAMGLSLGRYNSLDEANAGLASLRNRGIRTARIVTVRPSTETQVLRVPQASVSMQVTLASLKLPQGKGLNACQP